MSTLADDLSLGSRAERVLEHYKVTTVQDFMRLTRAKVLSAPTAGAGTWNEIEQAQRNLVTPRPIQATGDATEALALVVRLNELLLLDASLVATLTRDGQLRLLRALT